jgi:6-phosphofructokinase
LIRSHHSLNADRQRDLQVLEAIALAVDDGSIGATTAVEVALEAIDRLRTTASSMKRALALQQYVKQHPDQLGFDLRVTKLGHIQRGGAPGALDRMLELAGLLAM